MANVLTPNSTRSTSPSTPPNTTDTVSHGGDLLHFSKDKLLGLSGIQNRCGDASWCDITVQRFIRHFDEELRYHPIQKKDNFMERGVPGLYNRIHHFVCSRQPIELVLPAFPCKSPNAVTKVLGQLPDRTEEWALAHLESFCALVEQYYAPGCRLTIVSDGRVFADLVGVPDQAVTQYHDELENALFRQNKLCHIVFRSLDHHFVPLEHQGGNQSVHDQCRALLMESFVDPNGDARGSNMVMVGFVKYLMEDRVWPKEMSKTKIKQSCRDIAKRMIGRNVAFSSLVGRHYPDHIRLSIHRYDSSGPKYPIQLSPFSEGPTPWHSVAVELGNGDLVFTKRAQAESLVEKGCVELYYHPIHKRPWGYRQVGSEPIDLTNK